MSRGRRAYEAKEPSSELVTGTLELGGAPGQLVCHGGQFVQELARVQTPRGWELRRQGPMDHPGTLPRQIAR